MSSLTVRALRVVLGVAFLAMLLAQTVVLPWVAQVMAVDYPEVAEIRPAMLVASILTIACCEVVAVCIWQLLGMVQRDSIFSGTAFVWVDRMIAALLLACTLVLGVFVYMGFVLSWQNPGVAAAELGAVVVGLSVVLLLVVMRGLLRRATTLETEMAQVI